MTVETPTTGLGQFIVGHRFEVPSHQRDYSWGTDSVDQFLKDIEEAKASSASIYFCGLMVFTRTNSPALKVLDGQQRLATTLMIFSAMRNWMAKHDDFKVLQIRTGDDFLGRADIGETQIRPKLTLTAANNDIFQKFVVQISSVQQISDAMNSADDRNMRLLRAARHVNNYFDVKLSKMTTNEQAESYIRSLSKYIANDVRVVSFVLESDEAAYTIFETLNDRGQALKPLDLVKNYLFSRGEKFRTGGLREMEERWAEMMALLGSRADSFLRAFWASRHGAMEGSKLFGAFKAAYKEPNQAYQVSIDLRAAAEQYAALFNESDPIWSRRSAATKRSVGALAILGLTQAHPVILSALDKFSAVELEKLLKLLEVIAVRYQLIASGRAARVESLGAQVAKKIWQGDLTKASQVREEMSELYISDSEFKLTFQTKSIRDASKARYLLTGIERQSLQRDGLGITGELIPGDVKLEHILPQRPGKEWVAELTADPKLSEDMLHRLGNLCLLSQDKLGNKGYEQKRATFSQSRINSTKKVADYDHWGRKQIETRQKHMADLATANWRFP